MMNDLTLNDWADLAEVVSALSIVGGLLYGYVQIRYFQKQQLDTVATNLAQTFYSKDLAQAIALLQELPDGVGVEEMRARGSKYTEAAVIVTTSFETMGLLVYKKIAPMELVLDMAGGVITVMHRRLSQWHREIRIEQDQPSWAEWFDWLGALANREKNKEAPAHIRFKNWLP
jgi:hypothetical protein